LPRLRAVKDTATVWSTLHVMSRTMMECVCRPLVSGQSEKLTRHRPPGSTLPLDVANLNASPRPALPAFASPSSLPSFFRTADGFITTKLSSDAFPPFTTSNELSHVSVA
jgi:hypothetical protein